MSIEIDNLPGLTFDALYDAQQPKPIVYYRVTEYLPIEHPNGELFVVNLPDRPVGFFEPPVAIDETLVVYLHPANLPKFLKEASQRGYRAVPRD